MSYTFVIMNIFRLALELFVLYLLYKLIFDFIIPVTKTTKQVRKQFGEMSAQMQEKMNQQQNNYNDTAAKPEKKSGDSDDYIEFEEVKN